MSLVGREQQSNLMPASISFCRMPPPCSRVTEPEVSLDLQVPHTPLVHDEGKRRPACRAASRTVIVSGQSTTRRDFENSILYTLPLGPHVGGVCFASSIS